MEQPVVSRYPEVMGGIPVFCSTRVPVQTLLDYLEAGESIDDFLAGFPSVTRQQVIAFLEQARRIASSNQSTRRMRVWARRATSSNIKSKLPVQEHLGRARLESSENARHH
jgi:uncharacterized protein (DUF433 family)